MPKRIAFRARYIKFLVNFRNGAYPGKTLGQAFLENVVGPCVCKESKPVYEQLARLDGQEAEEMIQFLFESI